MPVIEQNNTMSKKSISYLGFIRTQLKKNKIARFALAFIKTMLLIALLADFISNEKPLACSYENKIYFPVFKSYAVDLGITKWPQALVNVEWNKLNYNWVLRTPIPYLPQNIDGENMHAVSPFDKQNVKSNYWRHWLGTDELGHDVLSVLIHGTRIAMLVGIVAMLVAGIIGIVIGATAGYCGDDGVQLSVTEIVVYLLFLFAVWFYAFYTRSYNYKEALSESNSQFVFQLFISLLIIVVLFILSRLLIKIIPLKTPKFNLPVDLLLSRLMELMVSIPTLFIIISIVAIAKPSLFLVMCIIGLTTWTGIARLVRGEILKIKKMEYINAAKATGISTIRIIIRHVLPNALPPVFIVIAFGIAGAILTESTLSFLGIGVPAETLTWGTLLAEARQSTEAWWLAVIPGIAIFVTVTVYNLLGETLTDAMDPRNRIN